MKIRRPEILRVTGEAIMKIRRPEILKVIGVSVLLAGISACSESDPAGTAAIPPMQPMATFEVTVNNLTNAQPLSPVALVIHQVGYTAFSIGNPSTVGLEMLAESGSNAEFLNEAVASGMAAMTASGAGAIPPGMSELMTFEVLQSSLPIFELTLMTMLVNTNDAITGINAMSLASMAAGDSVILQTIAYDSGTEANSESGATIPGPAGGGEGFNATRDDIADRVTMHSGVVTADDGLATSGLGEAHRFDNPVAQVTLTRTQ